MFAILGGDTFLAEEALERVLTAAIGADRQEALELLRGDEVTWARVIDAARTPSLFAPRRAVVVRGAEGIKGAADELLRYLEDPSPGVALVLLARKVDGRLTAWKAVKARGEVLSAEPLKGQALRGYVADEVRRRRLGLPPEAVAELVEHLGQDLRRLVGELDKLEAFAGGRRDLTADEVAAVLGKGLGRPVYKLGDAISGRSAGEALELVEELLDDGQDGVYLVGVLYRAVAQVRAVKALREARVPAAEIPGRVGAMPFKLNDLLGWAGLWSRDDLDQALLTLNRADRALKRGADARVALGSAVVGLCPAATREERSTSPRRRPTR